MRAELDDTVPCGLSFTVLATEMCRCMRKQSVLITEQTANDFSLNERDDFDCTIKRYSLFDGQSRLRASVEHFIRELRRGCIDAFLIARWSVHVVNEI